jgi:hypothetical protein
VNVTPSVGQTRRLDALAREESLDGVLLDPEDAADAHRVEPTIVDQTADRLRVDAELTSDLTHAVEPARVWVDRQDM